MAHVAHTVHVVFGGHIAGVQTWSTGYWFTYSGSDLGGPPSSASLATDLAGNTDVHGYEDAMWGLLANYMSSAVVWDSTKYYVYGEDPTVPAESVRAGQTPLPGGGGATLPPECAMVASLRTAKLGSSYRGRSYLPLLAIGMTGVQADSTHCGTVAGAVAGYLSSVNGHTFSGAIAGDLGFGLDSVVFSNRLSVTTKITSVAVDTKIDSQRRREHKLIGTINTSAVTN